MKNSIFFMLLLFLMLNSCKKDNVNDQPPETQKEKETIEVKETQPAKIETDEVEVSEPVIINKTKKKKVKPGLYFLEDLAGKYPTEEKIFHNKVLSQRLKKIRRLNYDLLVQNWNTETPITIENNIIHASGCKSHNCPESAFELFIDLKNDNINVYHFSNNTLRVYTEKGWIELPPGFAEEIEIKKENAKIGSTSDDIESKYDINVKSSKK